MKWKYLLSFLLIGFLVSSVLYPIKRIYILSTTFKIYFMIFLLQQINTIKDEIFTFHRCFQSNLISWKKLLKKLFYSLILFTINHQFYVMTSWMHWTFLIIILRRHKLTAIINWDDYDYDFFFQDLLWLHLYFA